MSGREKHEIVFFCGHRSLLGLYCLEALIHSRLRPQLIVVASHPRWQIFDRQLNGPARNSTYGLMQKRLAQLRAEVRLWRLARKLRCRVWRTDDANDPDFLEKLHTRKPNWLLCAAFPQILSPELLSVAQQHSINVHPSLLPAYAGAHPHFWAIRQGERESGITAHVMTETIDEGPILAQVSYSIRGFDYRRHYQRIRQGLAELFHYLEATLLDGALPRLCNQGVSPSRFRNNRPDDSRIFWETQAATEICRIVRTGTAFSFWKDRTVRILQAEPKPVEDRLPPGSIRSIDARAITVATIDGAVRLEAFQLGFRRLTARQLARRWRLRSGDRFH